MKDFEIGRLEMCIFLKRPSFGMSFLKGTKGIFIYNGEIIISPSFL